MVKGNDASIEESTLTVKGQTTLPRKVRLALGLKPGDRLRYLFVGNEVRLLKAHSIMDMKGILHRQGRAPVSLEQMEEDIAAAASEPGA
ncbi:MAG: AbrB/MazE/SpoVT family DNA-binding domain-containing protein [Caulobacterales bacterium]|jgi:bifunctional DNA-binding transcriptional regulator/antitoxin component of YhaV-PrlF toxin-antitoxin module